MEGPKRLGALLPSLQSITTKKEELPEHEYEHYVELTRKMIGRSYIQTAKMVENWSLDLIKRRYHDSMKNADPAKRWWTMRKFNL